MSIDATGRARACLMALGAAAIALGGCSSESPEPGTTSVGGQVRVEARALTLTPVVDVDYRIVVRDAQGGVVWERDNVRSSAFGDGRGSVSYVGPCDASAGDNTVELWINALYSGPQTQVAPGSWMNPTADGPLRRAFACRENEDVAVTFDVTVMRAANQGFFDIGVTFSDIFCSAKVDCLDAFLHRPDGGGRGPTVNVAFACTSGDGPTWLHYSDVALVCGERTIWLDPHRGPGQLGAQGAGVFQYAVYRGQEQLPGLDKCFWNLALGLELGADTEDCRVVGYATASDASFGDRRGTPDGAVYPFVRFEVPVTGADGAFLASCGGNHLNAEGSGVVTDYTGPEGVGFAWEWECDEAAQISESRLLCGGATGEEAASFTQTPGGVVFGLGDRRSEVIGLPAGLRLESCCGNPCPGCDP